MEDKRIRLTRSAESLPLEKLTGSLNSAARIKELKALSLALSNNEHDSLGVASSIYGAIRELDYFAIEYEPELPDELKRLISIKQSWREILSSQSARPVSSIPRENPDEKLFTGTISLSSWLTDYELDLVENLISRDALFEVSRPALQYLKPVVAKLKDRRYQVRVVEPSNRIIHHCFRDPAEEVSFVLKSCLASQEGEPLANQGPSAPKIVSLETGYLPVILRSASLYETPVLLRNYPASKTEAGAAARTICKFLAFGRLPGQPRANSILNDVLGSQIEASAMRYEDFAAYLFQAVTEMAVKAPLPFSYLFDALKSIIDTYSQIAGDLEAMPRDHARILARAIDWASFDIGYGIEVTGAGRAGDHSYLCGASDKSLPRPAASSMIPIHLRWALSRLPQTSELASEALALAQGLISTSSGVLIITSSSRIGSVETGTSPLLKDIPVTRAPRYYLSTSELALTGQSDLAASVRRAASIELDRLSSPGFGPYLGETGHGLDDDRITPSELELLGKCPFAFFMSKVLRVPADEPEQTGLPAWAGGTLVHRCLQKAREYSSDHNYWAGLIDAEAEKLHPNPRTFFDWPQRRREMIRYLSRLSELEEYLPDDSSKAELELSAPLGRFVLSGRLDRLDYIEGKYRIIDYKYARQHPKGMKNQEGTLGLDAQLNLYELMVTNQMGEVADKAYLLVKKARLYKPRNTKDQFTAMLASLVVRLESGSYIVSPDTRREACRNCSFILACREGPHLDAKKEQVGERE